MSDIPLLNKAIHIVITLLFLCSSALSHSAETDVNFYYFNPDSPQSNLNLLKQEMDHFLKQTGYPINFQPFAHFLDFDNGTKQMRPDFLFLPKWYISEHAKELNIRPILTPIRAGRNSYKKVLLSTPDQHSRATPTGQSLAMTSMGPNSEAALMEILSGRDIDLKDINIIQVPKDSDALFALILGQVDLALVSKNNLELMGKISPQLKQNVQVLMESEPIPMPILCYWDKTGNEKASAQQFLQVFLADDLREARNTIMEMLKIDSWQIITD